MITFPLEIGFANKSFIVEASYSPETKSLAAKIISIGIKMMLTVLITLEISSKAFISYSLLGLKLFVET